MEGINAEIVKDLFIKQKKSHAEISLLLQRTYPNERGLSVRSVRRFCHENGIHAQNRVSNEELEQCTREVVFRVGAKKHSKKC